MMDINFYNFDFTLINTFPRVISLNVEKNYCGFGTVEIHFSINEKDVLYMLEKNPYLFFVAGKNSAVVTGWRVGEDIAVFGRTPEWLFTKRGIQAFESKLATAENIARNAVQSAAGDFVTLGDVAGLGENQSYSTDKVRILYDVVCEVLGSQALGFRLEPDIKRKTFVFSVYLGQESLCMISPSYRTAYDLEYTVEKQDMVTNSGWYERKFIDMGGWDAYNNSPSLSDRQIANAYTFYKITSETYYQSGSKYYPVEVFDLNCPKGAYLYSDTPDGKWKVTNIKPDTIWIYIGSAENQGAKRWDAVLSGIKTEDEATAEISQMTRQDNTGAEVKSIEYGKDYNLGDIVRVQTEFEEFKKSERKRVVAVNIYYDVDKFGVVPTLKGLEE